jgi:hypothetical protein
MTLPTRLWIALGIAAALTIVIGANWHLVAVAFQSQPGCVPVASGMAAAKPGC